MPLPSLVHRGYRQVWADPARTIHTLESFAKTEADGGRDIQHAARLARDPWLAEHLHRHAADELRHAELFRQRSLALREAHPEVESVDQVAGFDLTRGRGTREVDAHGFFAADRCVEMGELAFVAMLHVAERRAAALFAAQCRLTRHDAATNEIFRSILRDEQYHVAWTRTALDRWRERGRGREVKEALTQAKGHRLLGAWKRLGASAAGNLGRLLLRVAYFTLCVPFGIASRRQRPTGELRQARPGRGLDALRSQY